MVITEVDGYLETQPSKLFMDLAAGIKLGPFAVGIHGSAEQNIDMAPEGSEMTPSTSEVGNLGAFVGMGLPFGDGFAVGAVMDVRGPNDEATGFDPQYFILSTGVIFGEHIRLGLVAPSLIAYNFATEEVIPLLDDNGIPNLSLGISTELDLAILEIMVGAETNAFDQLLYAYDILPVPFVAAPNLTGKPGYIKMMAGVEALWIAEVRMQYIELFNDDGTTTPLYSVGAGLDISILEMAVEMFVNNDFLTGNDPNNAMMQAAVTARINL